MDQKRELILAKETLEATMETPVEGSNTQLAKPIKYRKNMLMEDLR